MEDNENERPDKRRKLENDKGDGVIPAPGRSPRVVLSKIKLKEGVIERLRRIKKRAQEQVNQKSSLSTTDVPKNDGIKDISEQSTGKDFDNFNIVEIGDGESDRNYKRKRDFEEREEQTAQTAKITKIDSDIVNQETRNLPCEVDKKERSEAVPTCEKALNVAVFNEGKDVLNVLQSSASELTSSKDESIPKVSESTNKCSDALVTQNKGDEVIKAAQNYAKSGAQTEPKQGELLIDDKLVVVVTEVLEEGDTKRNDSVELEKQNNLDNNNHGEREEASDKDEAGDQDFMTDAIYQLIKDVIKKRTELFESALLRENEKLEKRVIQLEKQNALLQRVGYQLDSAVKEIIKKREQASQSRISRGTQVNMNLFLSRTSPMKSTKTHVDVLETGKDSENSPKSISNSPSSQEKNRSPSANNGVQPTNTSRQSVSNHSNLSPGSENATVARPTSDKTRAVPKPGEGNSSKTQAVGTKTPSESEGTSKPLAREPLKVSSGQQHDVSSHKTVPPGMGHFRLSPSYKRYARQQSVSEDKSEAGHYRITQAGLEHYSRLPSTRLMPGTSVVNEIGQIDRPTRPFPESPRSQKMDTSTPTSASQNKSNLSSLPVSSPTIVRQLQSSPSSRAVTQTERNQSSSVSSSLTTSKYTNVNTLERTRIQNKTATSSTLSSVTTTSSSSQQRLYTKEASSQSASNEKLDSSQCKRKESVNDEEPEVVIVSQRNNSSPKGQAKLPSRSEKPAGYVEVSAPAPRVQTNNGIQAQVRIQRNENRAVGQQRSQPQSERVVKSSNQLVEQRPQAPNHSASVQQTAYRTHDMSHVSMTPRDNVHPTRPNEPQQNIRYIIREDQSRPHVVQEHVRTEKAQKDPRQLPGYIIQNTRGQSLLVREQPPRYVIQDDSPRVVHEHPTRTIVHGVPGQPCQPIPQQPPLPPGAVIVQQHHRVVQGSSNGNKAPATAPALIGIQDVRTQPPQPYPTQPQQHIVVKQHQPMPNPQHSYQQQQTSYQYQQQQHRPTVPHQQNVPQSQVPAYFPPQNVQQAPPRSTNVQRSAPPAPYQPRPMGPAQETFPSSRIAAERATTKQLVAVGRHPHPTPDVVYRPGTLEATNIRPTASTSLPPGYDRYQPRPEYIQQTQGRQPQVVNQGVPKPPNLVERSIPRPSSQEGARHVQTIEQQRIQERRPQGPTPPEQTKTQASAAGRNDSGPQQQPSPPKPTASIAIVEHGIVLSWNITTGESIESVDCYELFACQDDSNSTLPPILWKKIGVVKALPLPMACTLTQFSSGSRYQFAVRAVDTSERAGPFSDPCVITLKR